MSAHDLNVTHPLVKHFKPFIKNTCGTELLYENNYSHHDLIIVIYYKMSANIWPAIKLLEIVQEYGTFVTQLFSILTRLAESNFFLLLFKSFHDR